MATPRLLACAVLGAQSFLWLPAMAQNTLTVPMEVVRIGNPNLDAVSPGSVTVLRLHPQYTLQSTQDSSRTELSLGAVIERSGNTDLQAHRTLPSVRVLWESSSPVAVFGLRASLEEASTQETEFAEFGRVTRDSTTRTGSLGGTWTRQLTASSSLELAASHARVSYDTPMLLDYSETSGSLTHRVESSATSRYSLLASAARLSPDGGRQGASRGELGLGYEVNLSETLLLVVRAGAVRVSAASGSTHAVGGLRLRYEGERLGYTLGWTRDVGVSGSTGGYARSQGFDASLSYPLSADTLLSFGVSHARSLERGQDAGATAYARIRSELNRFWAWTVGVEHRRAMPFGAPTARGNTLTAGLVYSHPDF